MTEKGSVNIMDLLDSIILEGRTVEESDRIIAETKRAIREVLEIGEWSGLDVERIG